MSSPGNRNRSTQFGDYTILEHLGEGGMCQVFRARRRNERTDCALKILKESRRDDEQIRDLFLSEADISLLVDHPNLIHTIDAGEVNGIHYIAMELIEGCTLAQMIARSQELRIGIPPDLVLFIVSEILEGLHALHTANGRSGRPLGLIHRDVTPHNVFLAFDGRVVLGDFGVAHIGAYGDVDRTLAIGKIGYLAPEVAAAEESDHRVDIFAAGIVLFEMLTDQRLFEGTDDEVMQAIAEARIPRLRQLEPGLSRGLEAAVAKALTRRPKDRFETAEAMIYELEPFWSRHIATPQALAAYISGLFREEAREWRARADLPEPSSSPFGRR